MKISDLGEIDQPLLLFGGPYSNLQATRALVRLARERGFAPERMICTGDVTAYCAAPARTVAEIRALGCPVVAGNCEKQLAEHRMDCGCGFEEGSTCDRLSAGWFAHVDREVGAADRAWMGGLPDILTFRHRGLRCAVIHGGVFDISRFIWPVSPEAAFAEEITRLEALLAGPVDMVIAGHCGLPFERRIGDVRWVNAGVIGMPPNDGTDRTWFGTLQGGEVTLTPLEYNAQVAHDAMRQAGLTQGYHAALLSGYWPSEDVLPDALRRGAVASG